MFWLQAPPRQHAMAPGTIVPATPVTAPARHEFALKGTAPVYAFWEPTPSFCPALSFIRMAFCTIFFVAAGLWGREIKIHNDIAHKLSHLFQFHISHSYFLWFRNLTIMGKNILIHHKKQKQKDETYNDTYSGRTRRLLFLVSLFFGGTKSVFSTNNLNANNCHNSARGCGGASEW